MPTWLIPLITAGLSAGAYGIGRQKESQKINLPKYPTEISPTPALPEYEELPTGYTENRYSELLDRTQSPYDRAIENIQRRSISGGTRGSGIVEARIKDLETERASQETDIAKSLALEDAMQKRTERNQLANLGFQTALQKWQMGEDAKRGAYNSALNEAELQAQLDQQKDLSNQQLLASLLGLTGDVTQGYLKSRKA